MALFVSLFGLGTQSGQKVNLCLCMQDPAVTTLAELQLFNGAQFDPATNLSTGAQVCSPSGHLCWHLSSLHASLVVPGFRATSC